MMLCPTIHRPCTNDDIRRGSSLSVVVVEFVVRVIEVDVIRRRTGTAAPCEVIGNRLTAEERFLRGAQVGRQVVGVLVVEGGFVVEILDLGRFHHIHRGFQQISFVGVVKWVRAHLLGVDRCRILARLAVEAEALWRRGEEVDGVGIGVAMLEMGRVLSDRVGVVVVVVDVAGVSVDDFGDVPVAVRIGVVFDFDLDDLDVLDFRLDDLGPDFGFGFLDLEFGDLDVRLGL